MAEVPAHEVAQKQGFTAGFMAFIRQYGVLPLAIAVVIGNAINDVVKTLVEGVITPLISLVMPTTALQDYEWQVGSSTFQIGAVISAIITFLAVAFLVYIFVKKVLHNEAMLKKQ